MGNSRTLLGYKDIHNILRQAEIAPIQIAFDTEKAARYFVGRCNSYRGLDRKRNAGIHPVGHPLHPAPGQGESVYDALKIGLSGQCVTIQSYAQIQYCITDIETGEPVTLITPGLPPEMAERRLADIHDTWTEKQKPGESIFDD